MTSGLLLSVQLAAQASRISPLCVISSSEMRPTKVGSSLKFADGVDVMCEEQVMGVTNMEDGVRSSKT